ncbi:MAG: ATP-binding protein [Bacteroidota bacterium]
MLRLISYTFCLILTLGSPHLSAQDKVDSLRNALEQLAEKDTAYVMTLLRLTSKVRPQDTKLATTYAEEAVASARLLNAPKVTSKAINILGICYGMQDKYPEAIRAFQEAINVGKSIDFKLLIAESNNNLALVYKRIGDYATAMRYQVKAGKLYDSLDYQIGIARNSNNLGGVFNRLEETEQAEVFYQKAITSYSKLNHERGKASAQLNLGLLYNKLEKFDTARPLLDSALTYATQNNILTDKILALLGLGDLYLRTALGEGEGIYPKTSESDQAEYYFLIALREAKRLGVDESRAAALFNLSYLEANRGSSAKSIQYARQAKLLADSLATPAIQSQAEEALSFAYQKAGRWEQALEHHKNHKAWQDSIFNEKTAALYKSQQVQMEVAQKDRELASQATQLASLNERVALENRWKWTLGGASLLLLLAGVLYYQKFRTRKIYSERLEAHNALVTKQKEEIEAVKLQLEATDDTINYFASSLYGKNTVDEILWDVAKNCISRLGLEDCVIYLLDEERNTLAQKAAYGPKNPKDFTIHNPIEIPIGQGIVGSVAKTGKAEVINDTSQDARYITDDDTRLSELTVPIMHQGKVIGVIDSEHPEKNFYTEYHFKALKTITAICASKIAQAQANEEARKAEEARQEAERIKAMDSVKSRFFANISHEFRTPLHLILGPLQSHQNEQIPSHELGMMQRNAHRLLRLVNQLMDLSKLEVGELQLEYQQADVFEFLRAMADSFFPLTEEKQITYQIDIPIRRAPLRFDPDKLEKIVYNLLSNAIKFTPLKGTVSFHASVEPNHQLRLSVSDTGLGIPNHLQEKIFDRFYQVDGSNTRAFEGTGIGLSLVKELVDLHSGTITLDSANQQGTTFVVLLPLQAAEGDWVEDLSIPKGITLEITDNEEDKPLSAFSEDLPQLLLVEDTPDLRRYILNHLSGKYQIREAVHGKEGWEMATEQLPDIIITDVMMPEMDGVELTHKLKNDERTSHIPIVMLTARDDTATKRAGFQTGADQYLTKPFDVAELHDRLQSLLRQRDKLREKYGREVTLRPSDITVNNHDAVFLEKCLRLVEENLSDSDFGVEHIQREIGMSRMQLHRKLKALTNQSATEFIRNIRLQKAAQMLEQNSGQVAEVAYEVGFNHLSYFAKSFKEKFRISPSEYAKSHQEIQ